MAASARGPAAFLAAALLALGPAPARAEELRAGLGASNLPARVGAPLGGYGGVRTRRATGTLDAPQALALVFEQGDLRVALVSLDVVIARPSLRDAVLEEVAPLGIDLLLVAATHTHSGPGGYLPGYLSERITAGEYDPKLPGQIAHSAARALDRAVRDLAPARIASANAPVALARNRRYPDGAIERELAVLRVDFAGERVPILLWSFGAHATVLSGDNTEFSADWPGAARAELRARGWRALFLPGPLGDQEPAVELGFWPSVAIERAKTREYGRAMADAVVAAATPLAPVANAPLSALERWVEPPPLELRRFCALWWTAPLVGGSLAQVLSRRVPVQVLRTGDAELLALPAEPSAAVGAALRRVLPKGRTRFVIAHANDWLGYVVDEPTYARGGYESCLSFHGPGLAGWLVGEAGSAARLLEQRDREAAAPP